MIPVSMELGLPNCENWIAWNTIINTHKHAVTVLWMLRTPKEWEGTIQVMIWNAFSLNWK